MQFQSLRHMPMPIDAEKIDDCNGIEATIKAILQGKNIMLSHLMMTLVVPSRKPVSLCTSKK